MKTADLALEAVLLTESNCSVNTEYQFGTGEIAVTFKIQPKVVRVKGNVVDNKCAVAVYTSITARDAEGEGGCFSIETCHIGVFLKHKADDAGKTLTEKQAVELSKQIIPVVHEHASDLMRKIGVSSALFPWSLNLESVRKLKNP